MITVEIVQCREPLKIGEYNFHKNQIYMGSNLSADFYINDHDLHSNHFFLEIVENKLLLHPHRSIDFYLIDGKRTTSMRYLKAGQKIAYKSVEFIIKSFSEIKTSSFRETLNNKTDELINNKSPLLKVITQIEEQLKTEQ